MQIRIQESASIKNVELTVDGDVEKIITMTS